MVFGFGVWGPSRDQCSMEGGDQAGADLIYIVSVMSLSLCRLTGITMSILLLNSSMFLVIIVEIHIGCIAQQISQQETSLNWSFSGLLTAKDWS